MPPSGTEPGVGGDRLGERSGKLELILGHDGSGRMLGLSPYVGVQGDEFHGDEILAGCPEGCNNGFD
jgi:hypothetical protein